MEAIMLAQELKSLEHLDEKREYIIQAKLDGARYQLTLFKDGRVELKGRHSNAIMNESYPEIITDANSLEKDWSEDLVLDGELIVGTQVGSGFFFKTNFSLLQGREHTKNRLKIQLLSRQVATTFVVFDIVSESLKKLTLKQRLERLSMFFAYHKAKRIIPIQSAEGKQRAVDMLFKEAQAQGYEGLMIKDPQSLYEDRRSDSWLKLKTYIEEDMQVLGYTAKNREISSLICTKGKVNFTGQPAEIGFKLLTIDSEMSENSEEKIFMFKERRDIMAKVKYLPFKEYEKMRFPILKEVVI
jgi:DNA ligase 1